MIKVRHHGRLQPPAITICEAIAFEFGPAPEPTKPRAGTRTEHRRAWDAKDVAEHEARTRLVKLIAEHEAEHVARVGRAVQHFDREDWIPFSLGQLAASLVSLTAEARALEPEKRTSEKAKHRFLVVQGARRSIAKLMVELLEETAEP